MDLEKRTGDILAAVVKEFIETGEPVSSGWIYDRYDFGIKPAMIRLILKDLDEAGYLEQPNYSAGRVPSDRGYEFFARYALNLTAPLAPMSGGLLQAFEHHAWPDLVHRLSADLGVMSVMAEPNAGYIYKTGFDQLLERVEWRTKQELAAIARDIENLDGRLTALQATFANDDDVHIYVGRKSPVTHCESLSVVAGDYDVGDGKRFLLLAVGPKRMDYQKTAKVFKNLKAAATKGRSKKGAKQNIKNK
ncbi:MAG TPA: hypothetical protein VMC43_02400 [Candidatus Paceibacterota bacterium]|nr:hypothetical protein [Candidatus Paceibacterota bacterium]